MCGCTGLQSCDECSRELEVLKGDAGDDGTDGLNVLFGSGAPSDLIGRDGEGYRDLNSPFKYYQKIAGTWVFLGNLKGIDGNAYVVQATRVLTSAEIKNLFSTPIEIIPNPGPGFFISVVDAYASMRFGTASYLTSNAFALVYTDTLIQAANFGSILTNGANSIRKAIIASGNLATSFDNSVSAYVYVTDPTTGDGEVFVNVLYRIGTV